MLQPLDITHHRYALHLSRNFITQKVFFKEQTELQPDRRQLITLYGIRDDFNHEYEYAVIQPFFCGHLKIYHTICATLQTFITLWHILDIIRIQEIARQKCICYLNTRIQMIIRRKKSNAVKEVTYIQDNILLSQHD